MNIEIHQPKLEILIRQRTASGHFENVEDALLQALESAPLPGRVSQGTPERTGAELVAAMQAMPHKNDVDFEHSRPHLPVREVEF